MEQCPGRPWLRDPRRAILPGAVVLVGLLLADRFAPGEWRPSVLLGMDATFWYYRGLPLVCGGGTFLLASAMAWRAFRHRKASDRLLDAVVAVGGLVLFGMCALAPVIGGAVYTYGDIGNYHLPLRAFYEHALRTGGDFTWCPELFCGFYLHGEGQVGLLHPWHLLLYSLFPLDLAFNVELLASYPLIYAGTFLFLRRWRVSRGPAALGAFTFAFCGFNVYHFHHINAVATIAHIPWLLYFGDLMIRGITRRSRRLAGIAIALLTGSELLLGYPQYFWLSALTGSLYVLMLAIQLRRWTSVVEYGIAKALGGVLGACQLYPTWESLALSVRAAPSVSLKAAGSLHPLNLLQFFTPYLFGQRVYPCVSSWQKQEFSIYLGVLPPLLLVLFAGRVPVRLRFLVRFALVLSGLAVVLALGSYSPLFPIISRLPVVGVFRCHSRHIVLASLGISIGGAVGLACVVDACERGRRCRAAFRGNILCGVLLGAALALVVFARLRPDSLLASQLASMPLLLIGLIPLGVQLTLVTLAMRGRRRAVLMMVIFQVLDLAVYNMTFLWAPRGDYMGVHYPLAPRLVAPPWPQPVDARGRRVVTLPGPLGNRELMRGVARVSGYCGLPPAKLLDYNVAAGARLAGAWYRWSQDALVPVGDPLPRARLVTRAVQSDHIRRDVAKVDLATTVLVSQMPTPALGGPPGTMRVVEDRNGRVCVRTVTKSRQMLVLSESYHPGWRVSVDGRPSEIVQAYGDFIGCIVGPGEHDVVFRWRPRTLQIGGALSGLALLALVFWGIAVIIVCRRGVRSQ